MDRPPQDVEVTRLDEHIQQLTAAVQALTLQREDNSPRFKFELPEFHGGQPTEELLDWIITVEEKLEFNNVPLERCVPMIAMRFRGECAAWWMQLKLSRARLGKPNILSWYKLKKKMRKRYLPFNYDQVMFQRLKKLRQGRRSIEEYSTEFFFLLKRVDLQESDQQIVARYIGGLQQRIQQHTLNLFNPLTIAEAHGKALVVEAQNKNNFWQEAVERFTWGLLFYSSMRLFMRPTP